MPSCGPLSKIDALELSPLRPTNSPNPPYTKAGRWRSLAIASIFLTSSQASADKCSTARLEDLAEEVQIRDFINRVPVRTFAGARALPKFLTKTKLERRIDLGDLEALLSSLAVEAKNLSRHDKSLKSEASTAGRLLEEAQRLRTANKVDSLPADNSEVVQLVERTDSYLSGIADLAGMSTVERSKDLELYVETIQAELHKLDQSVEVTYQVPTHSLRDELKEFSVHGANLERLIEGAVSSTRALEDCSEKDLLLALRKAQSIIQQIHDSDDRALVPGLDPGSQSSHVLPAASGTPPLLGLDLLEPQLAAVGVLVGSASVTAVGAGFELRTLPYQQFRNLCDDQLFKEAPVVPHPVCTAFVVRTARGVSGGAIIATAKHCLDVLLPGQAYFVRNFRVGSDGKKPLFAEISKVIAPLVSEGSTFAEDWALLELDRKLPNAQPLKMRETGEVAYDDALLVLGHPDGLPLVRSANARVVGFGDPLLSTVVFETNVDSVGGNSGSPVLSATTGLVEGILSSEIDAEPFMTSDGCTHVTPCGVNTCAPERVTRIRAVRMALTAIQ